MPGVTKTHLRKKRRPARCRHGPEHAGHGGAAPKHPACSQTRVHTSPPHHLGALVLALAVAVVAALALALAVMLAVAVAVPAQTARPPASDLGFDPAKAAPAWHKTVPAAEPVTVAAAAAVPGRSHMPAPAP